MSHAKCLILNLPYFKQLSAESGTIDHGSNFSHCTPKPFVGSQEFLLQVSDRKSSYRGDNSGKFLNQIPISTESKTDILILIVTRIQNLYF